MSAAGEARHPPFGLGMNLINFTGRAMLPTIRLPALLHWDLNHFVVLRRVRRTLSSRHYVVHDPARGVVTIDEAGLSAHWTGIARWSLSRPQNSTRPITASGCGCRSWGSASSA